MARHHFVKSKFREVYRRISGASRGFDGGAKVETFCLSGISGSPLVTLNYSYISLRKLSRHRPRFITTSAFSRSSAVSLEPFRKSSWRYQFLSIFLSVLSFAQKQLIPLTVMRNNIVVIFKCFISRENKYFQYTKEGICSLMADSLTATTMAARMNSPSLPLSSLLVCSLASFIQYFFLSQL